MKISKEELKTKVNELVTDNEIAIQLLEDIEDSMEVGEVDTTKIDELQAKLDDLQEKYKQRFLSPVDVKKEDAKMIKDSFEEPEEKKFIDVKIEDLYVYDVYTEFFCSFYGVGRATLRSIPPCPTWRRPTLCPASFVKKPYNFTIFV